MIYEFLTPANIWRDFDTDGTALETTEVRSFVENDALISCYYFTALSAADGKVRCFVRIMRPTHGKKFPTILVAESANASRPETYLSYVKDGFAVAIFDYAGRAEGKTYFTLYPDSMAHANYATAGDALVQAAPSAKHTSWHMWTAIARRVVTFLASLDYVDSKNIGMLGVKEGAYLAWQTVGTDERIASCAVLYGWDRPQSETAEDEADCWQAGVAPESYMPSIRVPVLVAGASNDLATEFTKSGRLANLPKKTPLYHSVSVGLKQNMYLADFRATNAFFNSTLVAKSLPDAPTLSVELNAKGGYVATLTATGAEDAEIFFAIGESQEFLSFRRAAVKRTEDTFTAKLGALKGETLYVLGKADFGTYKLTATPFSTPLDSSDESGFGNHVIYSSSMGTDTAIPVGKTPFFDDPLALKAGANNILGITSETGSLALCVADITPDNVSVLSFDTSCRLERPMTVKVVFLEGNSPIVYSCEVQTKPGKLWQRHLVELRDLKDANHMSPDSFMGVKLIEFHFGGSSTVVNNVLWL